MRDKPPWAGPLTVAIALAFAASLSRDAQAEAITQQIVYQTSGAIGTSGVAGPGVISYNSTSYGINTPSDANLGAFHVLALPAGQSATYTNTPFSITFLPTYLRDSLNPTFTPLVLTGQLNGSVNGSASTVVARFDPLTRGVFSNYQGVTSTLTIPTSLAVNGTPAQGGLSTVTGHVDSTPTVLPAAASAVPEPTTAAVLLAGLIGLGLTRRRRVA